MNYPVPPSFDSPAAGSRAAMAACLHGAKAPVEHTGIISKAQKAVTPGTFLLLALLLAGCTTMPADPIERLQQQAWAEPWAMCPGDWEAKPECSCRNRALWLMDQLADRDPVAMVGYRDSMWPGELHMVVAVDGRVIDADGVHDLDAYLEQWREGPEHYDWRIAAAEAGETR